VGFRLTQDEAWDVVAGAHTAILTTLHRDGRPVAVPVWHVAENRKVYVRAPATTKKLARIRNDDRAHFLVEDGKAWGELRAVSFEAKATIVDSDPSIANLFKGKYRDFQPPFDRLADAVRSFYAELSIVQLEPRGPLRSHDNSALVASSDGNVTAPGRRA
jgi:PPOX class probable F420-dependent enzyme